MTKFSGRPVNIKGEKERFYVKISFFLEQTWGNDIIVIANQILLKSMFKRLPNILFGCFYYLTLWFN
jgi:hypothetical protein